MPKSKKDEYYPPRIRFTEDLIKETVKREVPGFARMIKEANGQSDPTKVQAIMHQDAFAADYDIDELLMLGLCIKYAGFHDVSILFMGKNHETF